MQSNCTGTPVCNHSDSLVKLFVLERFHSSFPRSRVYCQLPIGDWWLLGFLKKIHRLTTDHVLWVDFFTQVWRLTMNINCCRFACEHQDRVRTFFLDVLLIWLTGHFGSNFGKLAKPWFLIKHWRPKKYKVLHLLEYLAEDHTGHPV